ncbi:unnamed protein product [Rotaria sp. Silwood2]|nr:unnamed protein product [Rotaria sp. Silwood2]CAF3021339.1 unnamed protein product [Rotaria sp. Silwood2]CAF4202590.1 unnamed protein product [Rotaria sp. Silwood2]CAF4285530.1 unnamed protein product [Rotaria sp. Silwood2]CAF4426850.1 unnamed protein product [Rotaria sp. Silwood2]
MKLLVSFCLLTVNDIIWDQITKCIELFQIENRNENDLFHEFIEIQIVFKAIQDKNIPLYDHVQSYINNKINSSISTASSRKILSNKEVEVQQQDNDNDDSTEENGETKEIRPDRLWAMLLYIKSTLSPNLHQFISFLFSIPCSYTCVESVFLTMKYLSNDKRNRMSTELITTELKARLNSSLSCSKIYYFLLSKPELLKPTYSNETYCTKK